MKITSSATGAFSGRGRVIISYLLIKSLFAVLGTKTINFALVGGFVLRLIRIYPHPANRIGSLAKCFRGFFKKVVYTHGSYDTPER